MEKSAAFNQYFLHLFSSPTATKHHVGFFPPRLPNSMKRADGIGGEGEPSEAPSRESAARDERRGGGRRLAAARARPKSEAGRPRYASAISGSFAETAAASRCTDRGRPTPPSLFPRSPSPTRDREEIRADYGGGGSQAWEVTSRLLKIFLFADPFFFFASFCPQSTNCSRPLRVCGVI